MMASFSHGSSQKIPGNPTIVLIHSPVALAPVVEFAGPHTQPLRESPDADLGLLRAASDKIHHLIPHIMRYPIRRGFTMCKGMAASWNSPTVRLTV
jgi:hypothetical protein